MTVLKHLRRLLDSGFDLKSALDLLENSEKNPLLKSKINQVRYALSEGKSVPKSIQFLIPKNLSQSISGLTQIPKLPLFLDHLISYLDEKQAFYKKMSSALMYPVILILSSLGILIFFYVGLMPQFHSFFVDMGTPVPPALDYGIRSLRFIQNNPIRVSVLGGLFSLALLKLGVSLTKKQIEKLSYSIKDLFKTWALLLDQGIDLKSIIENTVLPPTHSEYRALTLFKSQFLETGDFSESFNTHFRVPPLEQALIHKINLTGPKVFHDIYDVMAERQQDKMTLMVTLIQPVFLILIGGFIYLILITLFMPMMSGLTIH